MSLDAVQTVSSTQDWGVFLQDGLSTLLDGYVKKEVAKVENAKVPPTPTQQPVEQEAVVKGVFEQNMMVFGTPVNRGLIGVTGLLLVGIITYKALK